MRVLCIKSTRVDYYHPSLVPVIKGCEYNVTRVLSLPRYKVLDLSGRVMVNKFYKLLETGDSCHHVSNFREIDDEDQIEDVIDIEAEISN